MNNNFWDRRLSLLKEIKRFGDKKPLSTLSRSVISPGASLNLVVNDLENIGAIIKIKDRNIVTTRLTPKGEKLLKVLEELKLVLGDEI
jgi:DNA-binding HxlR family transcriptional regulator